MIVGNFFGFSGGGGGTPPPTNDSWLLDGNTNGAEKYFGTNDNYSIPIYTNGSAIGVFLNTGDFGFGTVLPTARVHIKSLDSTSLNYALKVDNSAFSPLLYVRNDGNVYAYGVGSISSNTSFGLNNLLSNTTGDYNTVYGVDAMRSNTIGRINVAIGHSAMRNSTGAGDYNIAIGYKALYENGGGTAIVAIGFESHISNTTGSQNTAVGYQTLKINTTGYNNSAIGHSALLNNIIGNNNSGYGIETLRNTNADNNTALGASAGRDNVSGTGSVFIGYNAGLNELTSNKLYISNSSTANPLIYGDFGTGLFRINSNSANEDTIGGTIGTTDATANVTAQTIAVPTNKVISLESTIVYRKTGGAGVGTTGDGTAIKLNSSVKNVGGTLTLDTVQNTYTGTTNAIAGVSATYTISGTNVLVSVTGVVNDNITWNVITKINTVS